MWPLIMLGACLYCLTIGATGFAVFFAFMIVLSAA